MTHVQIAELLEDGKLLYHNLAQDVQSLLETVEYIEVDEMHEAEERRHVLLKQIHDFDTNLNKILTDPQFQQSDAVHGLLVSFKETRQYYTEEILRVSGEIKAKAELRMDAVREALLALANGRSALQGYVPQGEAISPQLCSKSC